MGVSTDGQISFGISFDEDFEFPWNEDKYEGDIQEWWLDVTGFKPKWYPYTPDGDYKDGADSEDPRIGQYHDEKSQWLAENPLPVEEIIHCSYDYPMYIIAALHTYKNANRGYPISFEPSELKVDEDRKKDLIDFCEEYLDLSEVEDKEPKWWLSSLMG